MVDTTLRANFIHGTSALPPAHRIPAKQPGPGSGTTRGKYSTRTRGRKRGDRGSAKRWFERQTKTRVQQSSITTAEDSHRLLDVPSRRLSPRGRHQWLCCHKTPEQARDGLIDTWWMKQEISRHRTRSSPTAVASCLEPPAPCPSPNPPRLRPLLISRHTILADDSRAQRRSSTCSGCPRVRIPPPELAPDQGKGAKMRGDSPPRQGAGGKG